MALACPQRYDKNIQTLHNSLELHCNYKSKIDLHMAFVLLKIFHVISSEIKTISDSKVSQLPQYFAKSVLSHSIKEIIEVCIGYLFPIPIIIGMIILHGGYFKLVESGEISRAHIRYIESLWQPIYPTLHYNAVNHDILAPWRTLSAQEELLDLDLDKFIVIEYGSGDVFILF